MARKGKNQIDPEIPLDLQNFEADELERFIKQLPGDDKTVSLYRMYDQGRPKYITALTPGEFSIETVKNEYGGGRFKIVTVDADGERFEKILEIEGEPIVKIIPRRSDGPWVKHTAANTQFNLPDNVDPTIGYLLSEIRSLKEQITHGPENNMLQPLLIELIRSRNSGGADIEEKIMSRIASYKNLFGGPSIDQNIILDAMKSGIDLIGRSEGGSGSSKWFDLVEKALPMVQNLLDSAKQSQMMRANINKVSVPPPQPTANGAADQAPTESLTGFKSVAPQIAPHLPTFIAAAARDANPLILVDLTLNAIPPENKEAVTEWLKSPSWFSDLCSLSPYIQTQIAWWSEYRNGLLAGLTDNGESGEGTDSTHEEGD